MFRIFKVIDHNTKKEVYKIQKRFLFFWSEATFYTVISDWSGWTRTYTFHVITTSLHEFKTLEEAESAIKTHIIEKNVITIDAVYIRCFDLRGNDCWATINRSRPSLHLDKHVQYYTLSVKKYPDKEAIINAFGDPNKVVPIKPKISKIVKIINPS